MYTPVVKNTLHAGQKYEPITDGTKVHFHFQTWKEGKEKVLVDDSRKMGKNEPMALVMGHKFKLEVWETMLKMMAVGEIASFSVKKEFVFSYPFVSKTLRELGQDKCKVRHSCTMSLQNEGIGYPDLDDLINRPCDLEFIIELLKVEAPDQYERDIWQLSIEERIAYIPTLKERGNKFYAQKLYDDAEDAYNKALAICEQLMVRERKGDDEWKNLNKIKLPILLNYAQCKLIKGDYYAVIQHCTTVLEYEPDNEKALYRRAKAHINAWNTDNAEADLKKLKLLNPSMNAVVDKELERIKILLKEKVIKEKDILKKLFFNKNSSP